MSGYNTADTAVRDIGGRSESWNNILLITLT